MQKWEQGLAPLDIFKPCSFWHHTLSYFFFVDLAVELASNWHGVEAMRNLGPVKDFTARISQGQYIKGKVVSDLGRSEKDHGLTYTAFSRATKFLILDSSINI